MTDFTALSCTEFVDVLASKAPVPGGGGAAALCGALGTALGNMVGSLTVDNPRYANVRGDIIRLKEQADALQKEFCDLVTRDAEVFEPLSCAYGMPKSTNEERAARTEVMEGCLRACCAVPLLIMERCCEAIDLHEQFAEKGTAIAISDVGVGVAFAKAALEGASLNVFINTKAMADRTYAEEANSKARALLDTYTRKADRIFTNVAQRFA
ncbi:MAG: cyclodeaminase/cyclohydrolase family protein [Coriobacteriales bacterium]|jgi:formiminotetrahydrofolate cyclodeaminase|nr:cyclodeaminase/cyclohydrolase family protein [Coriobacteriales bacterium]